MCIGGKLIQIWIKFRELIYQVCVCYFNIYNVYMYKHKTVRNQLFGYLTLKSVIGNLETTDWLTSYSVKVHSTVSSPSVSTIAHSNNYMYTNSCCQAKGPCIDDGLELWIIADSKVVLNSGNNECKSSYIVNTVYFICWPRTCNIHG